MLNLKLPEQRRKLYIEIALRRCRPGSGSSREFLNFFPDAVEDFSGGDNEARAVALYTCCCSTELEAPCLSNSVQNMGNALF
ncbi:hypothetical protein [Microcoleus vaginatus]|uniref:hypothetical protein n=1 Tax=Microcoleus vaginatus TaxID=119532 RepID=UPI0019C34CB4|nr:hypothetical protein [Microcoleus sp. FACHB-84]MBD2010725.1 hypothetical protein [Microcoleus sp. FACHB-45]